MVRLAGLAVRLRRGLGRGLRCLEVGGYGPRGEGRDLLLAHRARVTRMEVLGEIGGLVRALRGGECVLRDAGRLLGGTRLQREMLLRRPGGIERLLLSGRVLDELAAELVVAQVLQGFRLVGQSAAY